MQNIPFDNQYIQLGDEFYQRISPTGVASPALIQFNTDLARALGIPTESLTDTTCAQIFAGNQIPQGAEPLAMAYSGHQFGHFNPRLGDGRALLLGELRGEDQRSYGIQLKGSGPTAYSRNGDGRAALGPVIREYLVSEAMAALGIPTTRALAAVTTGELVHRERPLPGGVITRVASSFVRVGTFQYFAARGNLEAIKKLVHFVIRNNYPALADVENPYLSFLGELVKRQAQLISQWMQVGFIHGVMNTDNMSVSGETIDYGPCAFMDGYVQDQVYSSIDQGKRYAFNNQPNIALWNITRLAESLLPLFDDDTPKAVNMAQKFLEPFAETFQEHWQKGMTRKIGLAPTPENIVLVQNLLALMAESETDYTLCFYYLSGLDNQPSDEDKKFTGLFSDEESIMTWLQQWREQLLRDATDSSERKQSMQAVNPVYIPRNHQIESVIRAAEDKGDYSPFYQLLQVLQKPFLYQPEFETFTLPPQPHEVVTKTFCGT